MIRSLIFLFLFLPAMISGGAQTPAKNAAATSPTQAGDLAPLDIKLPKPIFIGTPKDITSPNLEKPTGKPRPPFMAPKDVKLISLKKEVKASDEAPIVGQLAMVTDGDKEGIDGTFVELAPGPQWVQIDLGAPSEIFAVVVWHYHAEQRVYKDVIVRCADDPDFVTGVKTLFNNDHDNTAGLGIGKDKEYVESNQGKLIDCRDKDGKPATSRYLRCYSNGNTSSDMNDYVEVEVYGRQSK